MKAEKNQDLQNEETYSDVSELEHDFAFKSSATLEEEGLWKFAEWYKGYYKK